MSEVSRDWDGWLDHLVEDETARRSADVRAYLIAEISRAMRNAESLSAGDACRLAEIAVDSMIEFSHKNQFRPS
jgi:hypothetical protein